jgi:CitB family two-component system response regulator MalR/two-component system response regulator DctR
MAKPFVLVVEDEPEYAKEIADTVRKTGKYEVAVVNSAMEAFQSLEKNKKFFGLGNPRVGCILSDIKMPEMDGLEFVEKVRDKYGSKIGVIFVTAYEDDEKLLTAATESVAGYITKPFKEEQIVNALNDFFGGRADEMIKGTIYEYLSRGQHKREDIKQDL